MVKVRSSRWQKSRNVRLLEDGLTVWCESTKSSRRAKAQQTCEYLCVCVLAAVHNQQENLRWKTGKGPIEKGILRSEKEF